MLRRLKAFGFVCFLLMLPFLLVHKAYAEDLLTFNWNAYGRQVAASVPPSVKTSLERVKYIADAVGAKIRQYGITPNVSVVGRGVSGVKFGDPTLGTCDDVSESLRDALLGAGFQPEDVMLMVSKRQSPVQGNGIDLVNMSHAALLVMVDNHPLVLDLWMHGATTGNFGNFSASIWNGLDATSYLSTMNRWGYGKFYCHTCANRADVSAEDFLANLYRLMMAKEVLNQMQKQNLAGVATPKTAIPSKPLVQKVQQVDPSGQKMCAALMSAITKDKESEDATYGKYWVVFTRPYTFQDGACIGAHEVWRKKPDGSPPYAEVQYFSPESPARITVSEVKSYWKNRYPAFDWGL